MAVPDVPVPAAGPARRAGVLLRVETRGPAHCDEVISQLGQAGYRLLFS
jgi:hypothetical protein